jgi:hypothetical protein
LYLGVLVVLLRLIIYKCYIKDVIKKNKSNKENDLITSILII